MRIRKNAGKLSTSSSNFICQLNQSPWDIITFPSPNSSSDYSSHLLPLHHFQVDEEFGFAGNGSFGSSGHSIGANYSDGSVRQYMESEVRLDNGKVLDFGEEGENQVGFNNGEQEEEEKIIKDDEDEDIVLCCETNGKGWQCGKVVKKGQTMCARHMKKCIVSEEANKPTETTPVRRGRGRPRIKKKEPAPTTTPAKAQDPNEFYYYSGFGPLWGKKKLPGRKTNGDASGINHESATKVVQKNEEIDYMECDDDDEDEEHEIGKKRGRKRIKARSLKSLM